MLELLLEPISSETTAVTNEARRGLLSTPKTLAPWLFYDQAGCELFEQITRLPEYYLTRTERALFQAHAVEIVALASEGAPLTVVELGAGSATKTGILLAAALRSQHRLLYQPIDVAESALEEARTSLEATLPGLIVKPQVANYTVELMTLRRQNDERVLAMSIGSSIGNFTPIEARDVLRRLRGRLELGDTLLLGTDMVPSLAKPLGTLLAAYNDAAGITSAFNLNILARLNRETGTDFDLAQFEHEARWNMVESRIEMHLRSLCDQRVSLPGAKPLCFGKNETIHTENSYKFTRPAIADLLSNSDFCVEKTWQDQDALFAVTLGRAI